MNVADILRDHRNLMGCEVTARGIIINASEHELQLVDSFEGYCSKVAIPILHRDLFGKLLEQVPVIGGRSLFYHRATLSGTLRPGESTGFATVITDLTALTVWSRVEQYDVALD
jgi:hypothetical protein